MYECAVCGRHFESSELLRLHIHAAHSDPKHPPLWTGMDFDPAYAVYNEDGGVIGISVTIGAHESHEVFMLPLVSLPPGAITLARPA